MIKEVVIVKKVLAVLLIALLVCLGAAQAAEARTLREGRYIVGEDIPAGRYVLTCVSTTGEKMGDAYGQLGGALDAFSGESGYGALFGALGGLMEDTMGMTVEVLGDYGDVLKRGTLMTGDSVTITLEGRTALKITDGSCTLEPAG